MFYDSTDFKKLLFCFKSQYYHKDNAMWKMSPIVYLVVDYIVYPGKSSLYWISDSAGYLICYEEVSYERILSSNGLIIFQYFSHYYLPSYLDIEIPNIFSSIIVQHHKEKKIRSRHIG